MNEIAITSSRSVVARLVVAVACGGVVGITLSTAVVPAGLSAGGPTDATPAVLPISGAWGPAVDR